MNSLPLEGIKVVEFGTHVAVPLAARVLAEFGAEVIKIERPGGDLYRYFGATLMTATSEDENPVFDIVNMDKSFVCVNAKGDEGKAVVKDIIKDADVFITSVRPEALAGMGMDYETVKEYAPDIIYGQFTGYGMRGCDKDLPGFDTTSFWARGGLKSFMDVEDYYPRPGAAVGDVCSSWTMVAGTLIALIGREKTGKGGYFDSSLNGTAYWAAIMPLIAENERYEVPEITAFDLHGKRIVRKHCLPGGKNATFAPLFCPYRTKDDEWICLCTKGHDREYNDLMRAINRPDLVDNERFCKEANVVKDENRAEFTKIMTEAISKMTAEELEEALAKIDFTGIRALTYKDMLDDENAWQNGYLQEYEMPNGVKVASAGFPVKFTQFTPEIPKMPGKLGRDTAQILKDAGYSDEKISRLKEEKVIKA